jgi:hypothetical protein
MKTKLLFILCLLLCKLVPAQINLVPNSSFEDTLNCDSFSYYPNIGYPWFTPTNCTPDYYYGLNPICGNSALQNPGGYQLPQNGIAYVGFFLSDGANSREYISVKLLDTLQAGQLCSLSFYISRANLCYLATDDFGAYLSSAPVSGTGCSFLPFIPQFENTSGNFITDSINWNHFTSSYIALGGEQYLTIGNFKDSANTSLIDADNGNGEYGLSYYYIDNVTLTVPDSSVGINQFQKNQNSFFDLFPSVIKYGSDLILNNKINESGNCNIYSIEGRFIKSINIQNGINRFETTFLKSGSYLFEVNVGSYSQVFKIIIL